MLVGEPGIGKTRVAQKFAARAHQGGALVLWGTYVKSEWPRVYGPWAEALDACTRTIAPAHLHAVLGPSTDRGVSALG
jgi:MoxR-like ATPase